MIKPTNMKQKERVELKLGIKSSLRNVKQVVGLITALWRINDNNTELIYSEEIGSEIRLKSNLKDKLEMYFHNELADSTLNRTSFFEKLDLNPMLKSQIESLKVALELIWKLCVVQFTDHSKPFSAERTGGNRYNKKILYTKNVDLLDLQISMNEEEVKRVLFNWITQESLTVNNETESNLVKFFTVLSEEAVYRMRINDDANDDIIFHQEGIYSQFSIGDEKVNVSDYKENMGSLRILHSLIRENLNYFLKSSRNSIFLNDNRSYFDLGEYTKRINNYLDLTNINIQVINESEDDRNKEIGIERDVDLPQNWIVFGAPGTGKSYQIESKRKQFYEYERVTFHPSYTYAQFVGTYKPKPIYKEHGVSPRYSIRKPSVANLATTKGTNEYNDIYPLQNEPYITYEFIPGPLLRTLVAAINDFEEDIDNEYVLIIEEINRANIASVFGDIFQLLDRNEIGESEYKIDVSEEMQEYMNSKGISSEQLYFPPNFFIWATMNSADQGVYPMDTAFKRRWTFDYIDIDNGEEYINQYVVDINSFGKLNWNSFRKALNRRLSELDVTQDKLIGPFFISITELRDPDEFQRAFQSKLLMYLYEDVFKHGRKNEFFIQDAKVYSDALKLYKQNFNIFEFDIYELMNEVEEDIQEGDVARIGESVKIYSSSSKSSDDIKSTVGKVSEVSVGYPETDEKQDIKNIDKDLMLDE